MKFLSFIRANRAAVIVLVALLLLPAPLLPPLGLTGALQSTLGLGYKTAYLVSAIGLQLMIYGSLGVLTAFATKPQKNRRRWIAELICLPIVLVALAILIRSLKLGHVPMAANAVIPIGACILGVMTGMVFRRFGWRVAGVAVVILAAGLAWAFFPGADSDLKRNTTAQLQRLVTAGPKLASGEERFGELLETAFSPSSPPLDPVAHNEAAILALGIAIGHERLARFAGLDRNDPLVRQAAALRSGTSLSGRDDWARHYSVSAALAVLENPFLSETGGLIKEELDALARGSGFSFGDLAADLAGVRFAAAATQSRTSASALQQRLQNGYAMTDFFPPASDLPENLTVEQFRREYIGVGSPQYRNQLGEIEARLDRCAALNP